MTHNEYIDSTYRMGVMETNEQLILSKVAGNNHCRLSVITNNDPNGDITIRSQAMAEQLHFMLGQMLGKS